MAVTAQLPKRKRFFPPKMHTLTNFMTQSQAPLLSIEGPGTFEDSSTFVTTLDSPATTMERIPPKKRKPVHQAPLYFRDTVLQQFPPPNKIAVTPVKKSRRVAIAWTEAEDTTLKNLVGDATDPKQAKWSTIAESMGMRTGKQCRERWYQHLRPGLVKGNWTAEEDKLVADLHAIHGNKWSLMAEHLPHRTDNDIKNRWNAKKKSEMHRAKAMGINPTTSRTVAKSAAGRGDKKSLAKKFKGGGGKAKSTGATVRDTAKSAPAVVQKKSLAAKSSTGGGKAKSTGMSRKATIREISSETTSDVTLILGVPSPWNAYQPSPLRTSPLFWPGFNFTHTGVRSPVVPLDSFACTPMSFSGLEAFDHV